MPQRPKYPVYVPSKGRHDYQLTSTRLSEMGVRHYVVVEDVERSEYAVTRTKHAELLVLPFSDLGQGSIPARNWIWEHAKAAGAARHWVIDDNVIRFYRMNFNRRIPARTGAIFAAVEDWSDRYENVALAGLQNIAFAGDRDPIPPFVLNTRIYSMTLLLTALPYRWRGRYNEDTDLSLRALKDGWVTANFNAFLGDKKTTLTMRGGNTDTVYATGDHRREFAESLVRQHPDVARVTWKFNRWHHEVDYSPFKRNRLKLKPGVTPTGGPNNYGMVLVKKNRDPAEEDDAPDQEQASPETTSDPNQGQLFVSA